MNDHFRRISAAIIIIVVLPVKDLLFVSLAKEKILTII